MPIESCFYFAVELYEGAPKMSVKVRIQFVEFFWWLVYDETLGWSTLEVRFGDIATKHDQRIIRRVHRNPGWENSRQGTNCGDSNRRGISMDRMAKRGAVRGTDKAGAMTIRLSRMSRTFDIEDPLERLNLNVGGCCEGVQ